MQLMNEVCSIHKRSLINIENLDEVRTRIHIETQRKLRFPGINTHNNRESNNHDWWQSG